MRLVPVSAVRTYFVLITGVLASICIVFALLGLLFFAESSVDGLQGELVYIMYLHVPCAWISLILYSMIFISSLMFLIFRNMQMYYVASSAATTGAAYTFVALLSGAIWGKPAWGAWWVWDARLTSMLLLLFIYIAYWRLSVLGRGNRSLASMASFYAIGSFLIVPVIKFSVDLWSTLHQTSSVLRLGGPSIHGDMLKVLICSAIFHSSFAAINIVMRIRSVTRQV